MCMGQHNLQYTLKHYDVCLFVHFVAKNEGTEVEPSEQRAEGSELCNGPGSVL